ncbi:hypothetical protein [Candidatus Babela massiliensis]|uniref:Uncharacterized protein n=1 Tax=Candidatus Babela massiliensis TaxID=673862 RepID=V6DF27_9BACT|nr:hypothetical protein [Candidatus Babela massiliensis]CDK30202.1 hypothetical protein BABL1_gene_896 [Candidatus Babela massiliensis]
MPQVINETSLGGNIGAGLGSGLSQGLQALVQNLITNKQQQQQMQQRQQGLQALFPHLNSQQAQSLGGLDASTLNQLLKQQHQEQAGQRQMQNTASGLQALGISPQDASQLQGLPESLQSVVLKNYLGSAGNTGLDQVLSAIRGEPVAQQGTPLSEASGNAPLENIPQVQPMKSLQEVLKNPRITPDQRLKIEKMIQQREQFEKKESTRERAEAIRERREAFKDTKAERKEILDRVKAAREQLHDLGRMEELDKSGKLNSPGYLEFLSNIGMDISNLKSPESQEFQKIAANFLRDAKTYFGGRVSNYEIEQFLQTIPNLSQSPQGRARVIANLKRLSNIALSYNEALKDVMNSNKGIPPLDLIEQVDARMEKKLDKISEKFREDLAKPTPPGQDPWVTAALAGSGKLIGNFGAPLLGAGAGWLAGGPVGAGIGALGVGGKDILKDLLRK